MFVFTTTDWDGQRPKNVLHMLKSSSIPFKKKYWLLAIQIRVFQSFTPVQKDSQKEAIFDYQLPFFPFYFKIPIFLLQYYRFNLKSSSRLGSCFLCWANPNPRKSPAGLRLQQHLPPDPLRQQRLLICRETRLTNMAVLTSYQVYLRAQDTRPHNHRDQPAEQTSLFFIFLVIMLRSHLL